MVIKNKLSKNKKMKMKSWRKTLNTAVKKFKEDRIPMSSKFDHNFM